MLGSWVVSSRLQVSRLVNGVLDTPPGWVSFGSAILFRKSRLIETGYSSKVIVTLSSRQFKCSQLGHPQVGERGEFGTFRAHALALCISLCNGLIQSPTPLLLTGSRS